VLLYSFLFQTLYILIFKYLRHIYMWLQSRMNNRSDLSDANGEDESRVALHTTAMVYLSDGFAFNSNG
jgi:hypothetical protein